MYGAIAQTSLTTSGALLATAALRKGSACICGQDADVNWQIVLVWSACYAGMGSAWVKSRTVLCPNLSCNLKRRRLTGLCGILCSLAACIDNQIFCVHGGLSPAVSTLDQVCSASDLLSLGSPL